MITKLIKPKSLLLNKKIIAVLILFININTAVTQVNLVQNSSFEVLLSCPDYFGQINLAFGWNAFINGGGSSPDLYALCCNQPPYCGVPNQSLFEGFQYPNSGNNYVGIFTAGSLHPDIYREYIQTKLSQKLKSSEEYCVKFFCNLSNFSSAYITSLGAYLDDGSVSTTSPYGLPTVTPQIFSQQQLNDTVIWVKIEGAFVATGIEEYISIGNFFSDSTSDIVLIGTPSYWTSYYYIDDVSVIDMSLPAFAGNDTLIQPGDSIFIGRQPEIGLDEDCIWFVNGVPIDTIAGMWVQPDSTTTYVLEQTICGNVSWDTVTVSVYGTGIEGRFNEAAFKVYPNPACNLLTIEFPVAHATLSITNLLGQEVLRQPINDKVSEIDISKLGKGVYFLLIKCEKGVIVRKFLKE